MDDFRLTTPVALLIFNRPEPTRRVFEQIAGARPQRLLLIADGPRSGREGEADRVAAARSIVDSVDWDCEVSTNFSPHNLGCKQRVSSGLDWVFEQAEEAIIIEDDCFPDPSFFRYCQELLDYYRDDTQIGMVTGSNFQKPNFCAEDSYYFSKYSMIWGWATWRNRWQRCYDVSLSEWPLVRDQGRLLELIGNRHETSYWHGIFERVHRGEIDTWDYQWFFANFLHRRLCVAPAVNLISNIGHGEDATHTTSEESDLANRPLQPMTFPLRHPARVRQNARADKVIDEMYFRGSLGQRFKQRIRAVKNRLVRV